MAREKRIVWKWIKRLLEWLSTIPHLFGKIMVIWCVLCGSAYSFYALRIVSRTGHSTSAELAIILTFFGGELFLMFGRDALAGKKKSPSQEEVE